MIELRRMEILPVINCDSEACFRDRLGAAKRIFGPGKTVHIDVSDGIFGKSDTWINPPELKSIISENADTDFAVHLMIEGPEDTLKRWINTGVKEIAVHYECVEDIGYISESCLKAGVRPVLALNPDTPSEVALQYKEFFSRFLLLAVSPGPAGQPMDWEVIPKIKELRESLPDATIEVDGGVVPETARLMSEAGADIAVAGTYIFADESPEKAYLRLLEAAK
jgi:ribulose-phosphate 3-epimerase